MNAASSGWPVAEGPGWFGHPLLIGGQVVPAFRKEFPDGPSAFGFVDEHFLRVYGSGAGLVFSGRSPEPIPVNAEDVIRRAELGLPLFPESENQEFYVEGWFAPGVSVPAGMDILDTFEFMADVERGGSFLATEMRSEAKALLRQVYERQPFGLNRISNDTVECRFFDRVDREFLRQVFEETMAFNRKYFSVERPAREWWNATVRWSSFGLGPC